MPDRERLLGIVLVVVSACGFGSGALFAKPVYAAGVDWLTLLAWRFLFGALLSWGWLLLRPAHARPAWPSRRRTVVLLALGTLYVGNAATYFAALETVPASLAALIVYVYPALVAVLALRFGRRLEGRRAWFSLALASTGLALAVGGIGADRSPPALGLLLAVASPVIYAVWIVLSSRLAGERRAGEEGPPGEETDPAPAVAVMLTATWAVFWVAALLTGRPVVPAAVPEAAWPGLLGVGVVSTALAVQAFYAGARRVGAAQAALISTVEPVYTIALATLLFGEILTPVQVAGGVLVIVGVVLAQWNPVTLRRLSTAAASAAD